MIIILQRCYHELVEIDIFKLQIGVSNDKWEVSMRTWGHLLLQFWRNWQCLWHGSRLPAILLLSFIWGRQNKGWSIKSLAGLIPEFLAQDVFGHIIIFFLFKKFKKKEKNISKCLLNCICKLTNNFWWYACCVYRHGACNFSDLPLI